MKSSDSTLVRREAGSKVISERKTARSNPNEGP